MRRGSVLPVDDVIRRRDPRGGDSLRFNVGSVCPTYHNDINVLASKFEDPTLGLSRRLV